MHADFADAEQRAHAAPELHAWSTMRSLAAVPFLAVSLAALSTFTAGCQNRADLGAWSKTAMTQPAQPVAVAVAVPQPAAQAPTSVGEQRLDVQPAPTPAPAPDEEPVLSTTNRHRKVRTISDERLPKWVPARGRLTVVESSDLAENLGLVPAGTTKKSDERISVAEKLAEEDAARTSASPQPDRVTRGVSWTTSGSRFRNHRF